MSTMKNSNDRERPETPGKEFSFGFPTKKKDNDGAKAEVQERTETCCSCIRISSLTELLTKIEPWNLEGECIDLDTRFVKGWMLEAYNRVKQFDQEHQGVKPKCVAPTLPGSFNRHAENIRLCHVIKAWVQYTGEAANDSEPIQDLVRTWVEYLCKYLAALEKIPVPTLSATFYRLERLRFIPIEGQDYCTGISSHVQQNHYYYWNIEGRTLWYPFRLVEQPLPSGANILKLQEVLGIRK